MRLLLASAALGSALLALVTAAPAHAGWQSVFQVTCFGCSSPAVSHYYGPSTSSSYYGGYSSSYYSDPCCNNCPQQVVTTRYVQRSCYEPVTTYKLETTYQPVTSYQTSYYWQPVTSYRYTCNYDPCTCGYRQVATPVTCYKLQSQCCPVTSYVQRCNYVAVQSYRQSYYWEPQTCYSLVDPCTGQTVSGSGNGAGVRDSSGAGVQEYKGTNPSVQGDQQYVPPKLQEGSKNSYQRETERRYTPPPTPPEPVKPIIPKINSIAFDDEAKASGVNLLGQVVTNDGQIAKSGTRLLFVSDASASARQESTTSDAGQFKVNLGSGTWRVYVRDDRGQPVYQTQVTLQEKEVRQMTLVSRSR